MDISRLLYPTTERKRATESNKQKIYNKVKAENNKNLY